MPSHQARLVDISVYAIDAPFTGVLPSEDVPPVLQYRLSSVILCDKELIAIKGPTEVAIIEVCVSVDQRLDPILLCHEYEKTLKTIAQSLSAQSASSLNIYHWDEVLVLWTTLHAEVAQLLLLWNSRTIEVVRTDIHTIALCCLDIIKIALVNT